MERNIGCSRLHPLHLVSSLQAFRRYASGSSVASSSLSGSSVSLLPLSVPSSPPTTFFKVFSVTLELSKSRIRPLWRNFRLMRSTASDPALSSVSAAFARAERYHVPIVPNSRLCPFRTNCSTCWRMGKRTMPLAL